MLMTFLQEASCGRFGLNINFASNIDFKMSQDVEDG